jgi:hypothetical protein
MKNLLLLLLFFTTIGSMFVYYFIPKINQYNDIDFLEASLSEVITKIPESEDVYLFSEFLPNATATKYKTMMLMAPRIVIDAEFKTIPSNKYILVIQDRNGKNLTLQSEEFLKQTQTLFARNNDYYHITLLKKKQ